MVPLSEPDQDAFEDDDSYYYDEPDDTEVPLTPLPRGHWVATEYPAAGLWVPDSIDERAAPPDEPPPRSSFGQPQRALAVPVPPRVLPISGAVRPADFRSHDGRPLTTVDRPLGALRPVDPEEARQLAECFALDYLSWDEQSPARRSEALKLYLPPEGDSTLGWAGEGRQRADFASAGQTLAQGHWLSVDVRVRVIPYRRTAAADEPDVVTAARPPDNARPAAAPAVTAPGWAAEPSVWMRLAIPIRRHDNGELVVDLSPISEPPAEPKGDL